MKIRKIATADKFRLVVDSCRKWADVPSLTLARKLYREHPHLWPNLDACRSSVRQVRGNSGKKNKERSTTKDLHQPNKPAGFAWQRPESIAKEWTSFAPGTKKNLIIQDLHIPFHDTEAVDIVMDYGVKWKPDAVIINGDFGDFYSISKHDKNPTVVQLRDEIDAIRQGLGWIRGKFPNARIIYKLGNHDEWWERYLCRKAPELLDMNCSRLEHVLTADIGDGSGTIEGVEFVKDQRRIMLGKLPVLHGHELGKGFASPVNPARGAFIKAYDHILIGHHHQYSTHQAKTLMDKIIATFSCGCLCNLHPEYARVNQWAHGFATVEVDKSQAFEVRNYRIVNGKIW